MSPLLLITFVLFSVASFPSCFSANLQYEECQLPMRCGSGPAVFPNMTYPFWGSDIGKPRFCGQKGYELSCIGGQKLALEIANFTFRIVSTNLSNKTITVADESLFEVGCPKIFNFNGDDRFTINANTEIIDLFLCSSVDLVQSLSTITCQESNQNRTTYHVSGTSSYTHNCSKVGEIPILRSVKNALHQSNGSDEALKMTLEKGFDLRYDIEDKTCRNCANSSGICGSEPESGSFQCLCADKTHMSTCNDVQGCSFSAKIGIGIAVGLLGIILLAGSCLCFVIQRRKTSDNRRYQNPKALIPLKHYSYTQIKRITKSFTEVVGKGGFGTVYIGTLSDGRSVAVKILKDSKSDGEDFINEVASMSKTSHVNIVDLLGFCSEGSKRAIIYEFLENGSLDKFISNKTSVDIDWMTLYRIALGVARGLEYLHHG